MKHISAILLSVKALHSRDNLQSFYSDFGVIDSGIPGRCQGNPSELPRKIAVAKKLDKHFLPFKKEFSPFRQ